MSPYKNLWSTKQSYWILGNDARPKEPEITKIYSINMAEFPNHIKAFHGFHAEIQRLFQTHRGETLTHLLRPCGCSRRGTQSCGSGLGWSARPPRRWCLPGSKWRGRSGSSGTRLPAAAPCPPLWSAGGPGGRAGCRHPGGLAFWNTRPVSKKDMQIYIYIYMCAMKSSDVIAHYHSE